ncbi:MAG: LysM peptidoglycan-binding domain-containing protein [Bacilli bacterium]|nr:LysM peptidoglycan-binding domain-containing protein [Bacilli bacterium]
MRDNKKIEKELLFKNNIKEIISISLDSEYKVEDNFVSGNFLVSGEYKIHEVSVNREKFNFKIPFKEELQRDIDKDTLKLEITNFVYDYKKDELIVNIEYELIADRKDVLIFDDEESLDEFLSKREVEVVDTRIEEIKEEIENENINELETEENIEIDKNMEYDSDRENVNTDIIINKVGKVEDNFVTYKVYKIKENDTLEGIVVKFKTSIDDLKQYNDLTNMQIDDKLIIPIYE